MFTKPELIIYWVRRDFRMRDNKALHEAVDSHKTKGLPLLLLYILDSEQLHNPSMNIGMPRRYMLSRIVSSFACGFEQFLIVNGKPEDVFETLSEEFSIHLMYNSDIEPYARTRDSQVGDIITKNQGYVNSFSDQNTVDLQVISQSGSLYTVFSPYRNAVIDEFINAAEAPQVEISNISTNREVVSHIEMVLTHKNYPLISHLANTKDQRKSIDELQKALDSYIFSPKGFNLFLAPSLSIPINHFPTHERLEKEWMFTEDEALKRLNDFLDNGLSTYKSTRDSLALDATDTRATSRLSPALKWGLISPRTIVREIMKKHGYSSVKSNESIFSYVSELIWREFYRYILFHNPLLFNVEFQAKFRKTISWVDEETAVTRFTAWINAQTGYPIVDAAMNQIKTIGWMHNRSRMITASILTKNLGVDWRWGQEYFRCMLVDLDEASNNGGWQWAASVGADPKPIRIFNPYLQAENYDKNGDYQSLWLSKDYNFSHKPLVEHSAARNEALKRYGLNKENGVRDF